MQLAECLLHAWHPQHPSPVGDKRQPVRDALWPAMASLGSLCVRLQRAEAAMRAGRAPSRVPAPGAAFADPGTPVVVLL